MKKFFPAILIFFAIAACNNNGGDTETSGFDSSPMGRAPDNSAANNPSIADTLTGDIVIDSLQNNSADSLR